MMVTIENLPESIINFYHEAQFKMYFNTTFDVALFLRYKTADIAIYFAQPRQLKTKL